MNNNAWKLLADYGRSPTGAAPGRLQAPSSERHYPAWIPQPLRQAAQILTMTTLTLLTVLLFAFAIYASAARALLQLLRACLNRSAAELDLSGQGPWERPQADTVKSAREEPQPGRLG